MTNDSKKKNIAVEIARGADALEEADLLLAAGKYAGAISRAYYAVYHYARALLLTQGEEPRTHGGLERLLHRDFVRAGKLDADVALRLSRLMKLVLTEDCSAAMLRSMAVASIRVVSNRTGIPADTLRIWERRYGFPKPERTPGGSRVYTDEDVARLQLVNRALARCARRSGSGVLQTSARMNRRSRVDSCSLAVTNPALSARFLFGVAARVSRDVDVGSWLAFSSEPMSATGSGGNGSPIVPPRSSAAFT